MEDRIDQDNKNKEPGEDQLHQLIKEAGEEVRLQNKKMMEKLLKPILIGALGLNLLLIHFQA